MSICGCPGIILVQPHAISSSPASRKSSRSRYAIGIIATSPAAHLRYAKRQKRIRATPSFEEFKAIVENIRSQKFNGHDAQESADFVEFLGLAGLGKAEAAALRQSDIDWQRETITTFRHKTKSGFAIPIYPQLKPLLLRRRRDDAPNERVFKINDAKKAIANACRRLNLPQYSHISFRRMFITRAIERGVDVKVIAEWQGHKDGGKLILDTYSHVNRAHSHRMAQLMTDGFRRKISFPWPWEFRDENKGRKTKSK